MHIVQGADQIKETFVAQAVLQTEIADVHARQHDFLHAGFGNPVRGFDNIGDAVAAAVAPCQRNRAKTARIIAAVLHLQKGACPVVLRKRTVIILGFPDVGMMHHWRGFSLKTVQQIQQAEFFGGSQHRIHARNPGDFLRLQLRVAAHNRHVGIRRNLAGLAHDFLALPVRILRDGTRVDDKNIGCVREFHALVAALFKQPGNGGGFRKIQFATQGIEGDFFHLHCGYTVRRAMGKGVSGN